MDHSPIIENMRIMAAFTILTFAPMVTFFMWQIDKRLRKIERAANSYEKNSADAVG